MREQDYPLPDEFEQAFEKSDNIVLEVDLNTEDRQGRRKKLLELTRYPNNKSLKTELTQDVYNKLDSAFTKSGLILERMVGLKPVMAALTLTRVELMKMGVTSDEVDKHFLKKANAEGKHLLFLESMDNQWNLYLQMEEENVNDYILYSLGEVEYYRRNINEIIECWENGSVEIWIEWINIFKQDYPNFY